MGKEWMRDYGNGREQPKKTRCSTEIVDVDVAFPDLVTVAKAAEVVRRGGVVLYPTDTIYGLGADPFHPEAVQRILDIKGRPQEKGLLLLIPDALWVDNFAARIPEEFFPLAAEFWPGPMTLLFTARAGIPDVLVGEEGKIGLRHPDLSFLQVWMKMMSAPLVSTSANISGQAQPTNLEGLRKLFCSQVDLFLQAGEIGDSLPSTVVDLAVSPPRMVRAGRMATRIRDRLKMLRRF